MATRRHGLTADTYNRLLLDSGAVYKNYGISVVTVDLNTVIAGNTLVVNGTTFTAVSGAPGANEFQIGGADADTATNLATAVDGMTGITAARQSAPNTDKITITSEAELVNLTVTGSATFTISTNAYTTALIGATRGGNKFDIESEYREMPVDGAQGPVIGSQRKTRSTAKLTVNLIEMTTDNIESALPGADSTPDATHDIITRATSEIAAGTYKTNIALVLQKNGEDSDPFVFKLLNPVCLSNYSVAAADGDEPVQVMEWTAHFDTSDLDTEPWEISNPLEA
jgi:hypothetical protein